MKIFSLYNRKLHNSRKWKPNVWAHPWSLSGCPSSVPIFTRMLSRICTFARPCTGTGGAPALEAPIQACSETSSALGWKRSCFTLHFFIKNRVSKCSHNILRTLPIKVPLVPSCKALRFPQSLCWCCVLTTKGSRSPAVLFLRMESQKTFWLRGRG